MIDNLKEFKISTKRIQKILQTFEIKTPEAFRLSNSASLNFMARILGYENYNTIKPVLENNISKGNKMKIIKLAKNYYINADFIESFSIDKDRYAHDSEQMYSLVLEYKDNANSVYDSEEENNAQNVLNEIINFITSDEQILDLEKLISKANR